MLPGAEGKGKWGMTTNGYQNFLWVMKMFGTRERGYNTGNMLNAARLVNFVI